MSKKLIFSSLMLISLISHSAFAAKTASLSTRCWSIKTRYVNKGCGPSCIVPESNESTVMGYCRDYSQKIENLSTDEVILKTKCTVNKNTTCGDENGAAVELSTKLINLED